MAAVAVPVPQPILAGGPHSARNEGRRAVRTALGIIGGSEIANNLAVPIRTIRLLFRIGSRVAP